MVLFTCIWGIVFPLNPSATTVYARSAFYPNLRFTLSLQSAFYTQSAFYPWSAVCSLQSPVCVLHWPIWPLVLVGGVANLFSFDQVWWPRVRHLTPKIASRSNPRPLPGLPSPIQINIDRCITQCYPSVASRTVTTALIYLLFNISSIKLLTGIEASSTYRTGGWSRRTFTRGQTVTAESEFEREKIYQFQQKKGNYFQIH